MRGELQFVSCFAQPNGPSILSRHVFLAGDKIIATDGASLAEVFIDEGRLGGINCAVEAASLRAFLGGLPSDQDVKLSLGDGKLLVTAGRRRLSLETSNVLPPVFPLSGECVSGDALPYSQALEVAAQAVSAKDHRPGLDCVRVLPKENAAEASLLGVSGVRCHAFNYNVANGKWRYIPKSLVSRIAQVASAGGTLTWYEDRVEYVRDRFRCVFLLVRVASSPLAVEALRPEGESFTLEPKMAATLAASFKTAASMLDDKAHVTIKSDGKSLEITGSHGITRFSEDFEIEVPVGEANHKPAQIAEALAAASKLGPVEVWPGLGDKHNKFVVKSGAFTAVVMRMRV